MKQNTLIEIISDQTQRMLREVNNVIDCVPNSLWNKEYCDMPLWKHIYHMLHSLDLWFINPCDRNFREPSIHTENLNNLDAVCDKALSRNDIDNYFRHLHTHMGMIMGFVIDDAGLWPNVLGLTRPIPQNGDYNKYC